MTVKRQSELTGNCETPAEMTGALAGRLYKDPQWFEQKYWQEGLSAGDIARLCGVNPQCVYSWAADHKYKLRKYTGKPCKPETAKKIGDAQRGPKNHMWNGGRLITSGGYVKVLAPDHPYADKSGYVLEHRVVMEKVLGRVLDTTEVVHHKNHNRQDNRPENLEVHGKVTHNRKMVCPHCGKAFYC